MSNAEVALKAAKDVNADSLTPELYRAAVDNYYRAKRDYRLKDFENARNHALRATKLAEQAEFESYRMGGATPEIATKAAPEGGSADADSAFRDMGNSPESSNALPPEASGASAGGGGGGPTKTPPQPPGRNPKGPGGQPGPRPILVGPTGPQKQTWQVTSPEGFPTSGSLPSSSGNGYTPPTSANSNLPNTSSLPGTTNNYGLTFPSTSLTNLPSSGGAAAPSGSQPFVPQTTGDTLPNTSSLPNTGSSVNIPNTGVSTVGNNPVSTGGQNVGGQNPNADLTPNQGNSIWDYRQYETPGKVGGPIPDFESTPPPPAMDSKGDIPQLGSQGMKIQSGYDTMSDKELPGLGNKGFTGAGEIEPDDTSSAPTSTGTTGSGATSGGNTNTKGGTTQW